MLRTTPRPVFGIGLLMSLLSIPLFAEEPRESGEDARRALRNVRREALSHGTVALQPPPPQSVVTPSSFSLSLDGDLELGGYVFQDGIPLLHTDGGANYGNTALGLNALVSATPGAPYSYNGSRNSAFGNGALRYNTTGSHNTASGYLALSDNTTGSLNTASGGRALHSNTTGSFNTAQGFQALRNNTTGDYNTASGGRALDFNTNGSHNTANGFQALRNNTTGGYNTASGFVALALNTTGSFNTAIGVTAGSLWRTGNYNIAIGVGTSGLAAESGVIRIGGADLQTKTYIEGIHSATLNMSNEQPVCVDDSDQVGPCSISSVRFKYDIRAMGESSVRLEALRPVAFKYRPEVKEDTPSEHFGLIAEEVAEIYPHLVTTDADGKPFSVRYDLLTPLLLNELQKAQQRIDAQDGELASLKSRLDRLEAGAGPAGTRPTPD